MGEAKINKDMMYWAREYAGFVGGYEEDLPKSIRLRYKAWESGEKYPTWNQLREVSKKYKLPTAFFFMKEPPKVSTPKLINYRKLNDEFSLYNHNSPSLLANIRKSEVRRNIYKELLEDMGKSVPKFKKLDIKLGVSSFVDYIRTNLNVSLDEQKTWLKNSNNSNDNQHYTFLDNWKQVLTEKLGVLIFETKDVDIYEMRGLCIFYDEIPIILLNGKDSPNGRIFSLFHELTHLLMGESAICGDDENESIEVFCNNVAGNFLVPKENLVNTIKDCDYCSEESLKKLSHTYGVSKDVILRRLYDIKKINRTEYESKIEKFTGIPITSGKKGGGGNYLNNQIKYNSKPYYSLIVSAYDSGVINISEFTKFTNLSQKHIPEIRAKVSGGD